MRLGKIYRRKIISWPDIFYVPPQPVIAANLYHLPENHRDIYKFIHDRTLNLLNKVIRSISWAQN